MIGSQYCVWNDIYPGIEEIRNDFQTGNLYVINDDEQIIGAASIVPENEMDALPFWKMSNTNAREIARIVVSKEFQNRGIATQLVNSIIGELKFRGASSVRLSVAIGNIPAFKVYQKIGFEIVGETDMYNNRYYLFERTIQQLPICKDSTKSEFTEE